MNKTEMKYTKGSFSSRKPSKEEMEALRERRMSEYEGKTAAMPLCVFNLMNAILGSGIIGLANAVVNLGIIVFTILLILVAGLAFYSITLLVKMCDFTGSASYEAIGKAAYGWPGKVLTIGNIFVHTIGAMCSFLFIVKYELPEVIRVLVRAEQCDSAWYLDGNILTIMVTVIIIMPLAAAKNIGFLGYTSGFAMACMIFFTGVIVAEHWIIPCPIFNNSENDVNEILHSVTDNLYNVTLSTLGNTIQSTTIQMHNNNSDCTPESGSLHKKLMEALEHQTCDTVFATWNKNSAYAIPTMVFAFQCHASVLPIYTELKTPTHTRMHKVAVVSIANVFVLYFLAALFGYLTFKSAVGPELLLMYSAYDASNPVILISRVMVLICVIFSTPLLHYPARKSLIMLFFERKPFSWIRHLAIMAILLTTTNLLVIFVPDIREVFGFAGATCASMLVIILPSLFYLRIGPGSILSTKKIVSVILVSVGFVFMIFSMVLIIASWCNVNLFS